MNSVILAIVIFFSHLSKSQAMQYEVPLQIQPDQLYVDQEEKLQILVKPKPELGKKLPTKLFLVKVDETGKRLSDLAVITDEGTLGDMKAGDGYYSRKVKIIERLPGTLRLSLSTREDSSETFPVLNQIQVITRPSFLEVLGEVWRKITRSEKNAG